MVEHDMAEQITVSDTLEAKTIKKQNCLYSLSYP